MGKNLTQKKERCNALVVFLFLYVFTQAAFAGNANSQGATTINLNLKNVEIKNVIKSIEKQTEYRFFYTEGLNDMSRKVNVNSSNESVENILSEILASTQLGYKVYDNKTVVIAPREAIQNQEKTPGIITGTIVDNNKEPLIGVNVIVKGTSRGTISNIDGQYSIQANPNETLVFSFLGYKTLEMPVGSKQVIDVTLFEDAQLIDEVVVVGYGTQKKLNMSGAVSSIKMDDVLGSRPVASTSQVLEGAVPGLQISRNNGKPGVDMNLNIRGVTSINDSKDNNGGKPLVLVDHVPMDIEMLDPNDIESVSVLKDAASAAIYGARAAFGIILITTKKGNKDTPVSVNYSNNFSFSKPATLPKKIDPYATVKVYQDQGLEQYWGGQKVSKWLNYMDEYYNKGMYPEGYVMDDGYRYSLAETDAYKDMMDNFGFQQQHNLSLTGGGSSTQYRLSFGMVNEDGVLVTDKDKYTRYNAGSFFSIDATKWLTGQMDVHYSDATTSTAMAQTAERSTSVVWNTAFNAQPMSPLGYGTTSSGESMPYNTAANYIRYGAPKLNKNNNTRLLGRMILKPFTGMEIIGEYSFYLTNWQETYSPKIFNMINTVTNDVNTTLTKNYYEIKEQTSRTNAINAYATYSKMVNDVHDFKIMGGYNQESYYFEELYSKREDLINQNLPSLGEATGAIETNDNFNEAALRSLFYRFNYTFKDRYIFETNGRYDGSSRFPKDERFGFFPSFSGAWRISEEEFMEPTRKILDNLKFRASWGSIGNQNVDYYGYMPIMKAMTTTTDKKSNWILPGGTNFVTSLEAPYLVSTPYTWETVETLDFGIDVGLFNNKLNATFDWYQRNTKDMLTPAKPMPNVLGTKPPKVNAADLQTKGWELSVNWQSKIGENIRYNIGLNLFDSKSIITRYDNPTGQLYYNEDNQQKLNYREGMEFGEIWGYTTDRFYTANDFENGQLKPGIPKIKGSTPNPGDILYVNYDDNTSEISEGDNTYENPGDMRIIGNTSSRYQFGITGGISWKNFDFSFFINGTGKRDIWMPDYWIPNTTFTTSVYDYQTNYWTEENTNSYWPKLYGTGGNDTYNNKIQSKYLRNGSFIRLKNITLAYNLPKEICKQMYIKNLRVFVGIENLYTWHHLPKGFYPDSYVSTPGSTSMNPGVAGDSGWGAWSYPLMRQMSFGLNLTF